MAAHRDRRRAPTRWIVVTAALLAVFDPGGPGAAAAAPASGQQASSGAVPRAMAPAVRVDSITLPPEAPYPNGIAHVGDGALLIGSITSGRIIRGGADGWTVLHDTSATVFAATALRLDAQRRRLWGASPDFLPPGEPRPDRIFIVDMDTGAELRSFTMPAQGFGNDLALAPDGSAYVTDSRLPLIWRVRPEDKEPFTIHAADHRFARDRGVGLAGVALAPDGTLVVAHYGRGQLFIVAPDGTVREMPLARPLENPDGLAFADDGALIVLEGAVASGDGRVSRIPDPLAADAGPRPVEVLLAGLESPVNLTTGPGGRLWVTESRIRHRLIPGMEAQVPDRFRVLRITLGPAAG